MFRKDILLWVSLLAVMTSTHACLRQSWANWKEKYGKHYASIKEEMRSKEIWANNALYVEEHNQQPGVAFQMELNSFADKTVISRPPITLETFEARPLRYRTADQSPDSWDWRPKGVISPVQNQGQLGDVLSIVATECVESLHAIRNGSLVRLSVMEMHDCCVQEPIASLNIFDCIRNIGGLCSQASYPESQGKCMNNTCSAVAKISGGKVVLKGDEDALKDAVYREPVMALIDASHPSFQLYKSGVYSDPRCTSTRLDHSVQVVGYGSSDGQDFWICKNSWGTSWGMDGYVLIARNKNNMCGIATMAMYPD